MTELVIIADDLTGAADSAAALTSRGRTSIVIDPAGEWPDDDVLAIDTDSRHCPAEPAVERVREVSVRARELGAQVVKKIDSTLRGNITAELRAVLDVLGDADDPPLLVVAPAFPATSRTTLGGIVHVDGERLAAHGSNGDVVELLQRGDIRTGRVGLAEVNGAPELAARLDHASADGFEAVVVDSESDEHLRTVVEAADLASVRTVLVGSGGLTRPLAPRRPSYEAAHGRGPTLVVVGSYAPVSRVQRQRLVEHGCTPVLLDTEGQHTADRLRAALASGTAVLSPDPDAPVVREQAPHVARALAQTVVGVLGELGTLVATGGETARAVLTAAGVTRLVVTGEIEPGIVRSHVPELSLELVTKAGAFGDADALLRCVGAESKSIQEEIP